MELFVSATSNPLGLLTEFEDLLSDYCAFVSDDSKDAGQIEVMNKDGQIIGTVISKRIREDPGLSIKGHEKDPVLLELPPQEMQMEKGSEISGGTITARRAPLNTESKIDWIVVGAQYVSAGIVKGSTLVAKGMSTAAENYSELIGRIETSSFSHFRRKISPISLLKFSLQSFLSIYSL